eukprot:1700854-Pyramimonas_sp.AAC.1
MKLLQVGLVADMYSRVGLNLSAQLANLHLLRNSALLQSKRLRRPHGNFSPEYHVSRYTVVIAQTSKAIVALLQQFKT